MELTIFYSWQMKTPSTVNKDFIERCLSKAANDIENKGKLKGVFFNIDCDTRNIPGTPNIDNTIEEKINNCNLFLADLTIHHMLSAKKREKLRKKGKDPCAEAAGNVYTEYGQAKKVVGNNCIICVANTFFGPFDEQIFDLNHYRKPIEYKLPIDKVIDHLAELENKKELSLKEKLYKRIFYKKLEKFKKTKESIEKKLISYLEPAIKEAAIYALVEDDKKYPPFHTFAKQNNITRGLFEEGKFKEKEAELSSEIKCKNFIRVRGVSGLGKTSLVYKAFDNDDERNNYRYFDLYSNPGKLSNIIDSLKKANDNKEKILFVIDNCDIGNFYSIKASLSGNNQFIKIITITNDHRENEKGIIYFDFTKDDTGEIIDKILSVRNIKPELQNRIKEFSCGNTQMVYLLTKQIDNNDIDPRIENSELMNKLLKTGSTTDERKIFQSLALFRYIGFYEPIDKEYKLIARNQYFTPIDGNEIGKEIKVFNVYKNNPQLFETKGKYAGIRPLPLAFYLAEEWFDSCVPDQITQIMNTFDTNPDAETLVEPFCIQIRNLNDYPKAIELVAKLVSKNGPFGNAEVLSSKTESRLFRSFAEVAPEAVADNLYNNITQLSFEAIQEKVEGRRNTVWTLQTLCFDKRSFEKAAKTLLHISVAENETYGNNATNEFTHLFSIYIPGTEASLGERFNLLSWAIKNKDYKPLIIKSLYNVFEFEHTVYLSGAEKQGTKVLQHYEPTEDEIIEYFTNCFNLLKKEIVNDTEFKEECKTIICNSLRCLCRFGYIDFILPRIIELVKAGNKDWDDLVKSINSVKAYDLRFVKPESRHLLDDCLDLIKKEDFFSRFILASELESYGEHDFDTLKKLQENEYKALAEEFSQIDNLDEDKIRLMYSKECYFSRPFGFRLAELWNDNDKKSKDFISKTLNILINMKDANLTFFSSFLEKTKNENYEYCINLLKQNEIKNSLIFKLGSIRNTSFNDFSFIFDLIQKNNQLSSFLYDFSQWHNWEETSDLDVKKFFVNTIKLPSIKNDIIYNIAFRVFAFEKIEKYKCTFDYICDYTRQYYTKFDISGKNSFYEFAETILRNNKSTEFAELVNDVLLYSLSNSTGYEGNGHYEPLFTNLMKNYFDNVFPKISEEFLNQKNPFEHFNLVNIFRSVHGSHNENRDMLFFAEHQETYLQWCDENLYAPVFLAEIIPVYGEQDISPVARLLIERYYDREKLLRNISINMANLMWCGSIVPVLEHKKRIYKQFENSEIKEIREWAKLGIDNVNVEIQQQQNYENEQDFINGI